MAKIALTAANKIGARLGPEGVEQLREDSKRRERQATWIAARDARLRDARQRRLDALISDDSKRGDVMAANSWNWLTGQGAVLPTPTSISLRTGYVARDDIARAAELEVLQLGGTSLATGPPLSNLASDSGRGIRLHLACLGVASLVAADGRKLINDPDRKPPGRKPAKQIVQAAPDAARGLRITQSDPNVADWAKILGIPAVGKARTVRVHEVLKRLELHSLVALTPGQPSRFTLLSEDGAGRAWTRPELDPLDQLFVLPFDFWKNRWYLWLTASEIATLIAVYHAWRDAPQRVFTEGLGLPESVRRSVYDMSGERYSSLHELIEFGLIEMVSPSLRPNARSGAPQDVSPGTTHHFRPIWTGMSVDARSKITTCLSEKNLPPRLDLLPFMRATYAANLRAARQLRAD